MPVTPPTEHLLVDMCRKGADADVEEDIFELHRLLSLARKVHEFGRILVIRKRGVHDARTLNRIKVHEMDESYFENLVLASLAPLVIGGIAVVIAGQLRGIWLLVGLAAAALLFAILFARAARWSARRVFVRGNYELGWYGERVVGDALAPLERKGWRVFHDFPRSVKEQKFNIDHIAVGPAGIFAVETKTPRKGDARPGKDGHVVEFDGHLLHWPWAENRLGIDQALDNADWLRKWLRNLTGQELPVQAVLAFPDWMVRSPRKGPLLVLSSSLIEPILSEQPSVLSLAQVDQVARLIEAECRDVEY